MGTGKYNLEILINSIKEDSNDAVILVEGKRDKDALEKVGILPNNIIEVSYKNQNQICNEIELCKKRKIIPLYDNDRTGNTKMYKLSAFLSGLDIKILDYRKKLNHKGITYIEEIDNRLGI